MAQRAKRDEAWSFFEHTLAAGEKAERGHMACIDLASGELVVGTTGEGLLPIGYFDRDLIGDGIAKARVQLFSEKWVHRWRNDTGPGAVDSSDVGSLCYVKDSETVTITATGASVAGRIWAADEAYVWVEMASDLGLQGTEGA